MKKFHIIFFCYVFLFSIDAVSQFHFRKYQVNDGLSENTINCLMQDSKGFLWLGTKDGLNRFDGVNFIVYRHAVFNEKSIGNNHIKSIVESDDRLIYIGTDDGLFIMDRTTGEFDKLETKLNVAGKIITSITSLLFDKNGMLWITTKKEGVFIFDPQKKELSRVRSSDLDLTRTTVWTLYEDKSGVMWAGTRSGLFQYNPAKKMFESVIGLVDYGNNSNKEILTIFEDTKGNLWLGTWSDGILFYNKQQKGAIAYCGPTDKNNYITHIRSFLQYDNSHLLVGADDGLYLFNTITYATERIDVPYDKYSLGDQNVYSLLRDKEGGIWVGTYFGGLNYLNTNTLSIECYMPNDRKGSLSGKAVSQFCEDNQGNLWIATEDGGLNYFNTKTKTFSQPVKTSYHNIHPLLMVGDELWIGTFSRGLDVYNTKTKKIRNYKNHNEKLNTLDDDCIFSLCMTRSGEIYVGTTNGLNRYNAATDDFTRITSDSISFVYDIIEDSDQNLWIASYNDGAAKLNLKSKQWTYYSNILDEANPIINSKLTGIHIDNQKRLWFSSEGKGLFLYDNEDDNFINITEKDGLPNNVVYGVLDDQFGKIWVSSNSGLVSFPPFDVQNQNRYSLEDGLQGNQFNYKSSYKASDGKLYFGGINGFNCFYPQELNSSINTVIPAVEITGMQILGDKDVKTEKYILNNLNSNGNIRLKHYNASFTISFVSLSFISPSRNQYAYKLEGVDSDWNQIDNNRSVTYVNLAPGKYLFRVKASNNNNIWNERGAELKFEILPPFWLSLPARIFYVVLTLIVFFMALIYYVKKNQIKQKKHLEAFKTEQEILSFKSKIDFFTNIAHEIRTPVSLIKAPLEEIVSSGDGNTLTRQNLSIIEKNSDRLSVLINQLLDFRKMGVSEYVINSHKLDLIKYLSDLYERFRKTALSKNIDFQITLPNGDVNVISDADALTKITGNFLTNALKFTTDKVILKLEVNQDESYCISVIDNGKGIPDKQKVQIFDPFYQIQSYENNKGTGIGLYLAKQLSEILQGNIEVKDNPTGGSVFSFTFKSMPIETSSEVDDVLIEPAFVSEDYSNETNVKKNILVVEDNSDMLHFIENSLRADYEVDISTNAKQALKMVDDNSYDLIITDIMMYDVDGIELTRTLRENICSNHVPIILLSAKNDNNTKIEGLNAGANVFIEKPFSISYLKAQISSLLANRDAILDAFNHSPLTSYSILTTNKSVQEFINKLNEEIDKNISDNSFSVENLSDKLFISRSNFQRKLKSICGHTPGDYLRTYRLKKAAQLLLENGLRINEVAFEVGFNSASYFTKCFVKQFGMLPKDFVKKNQ